MVICLLVKKNRIGGVMVSVLASSAVDSGFEPRSGQTKNYKIGIKRAKTGWLGIRIMCPSGATVVSVSAHYKNPTQRVGLVQSGPHHHDIAEKLLKNC